MTIRCLTLFALVLALFSGCKASPAAGHKAGLVVNSTSQVGETLAEIPFASWNKTAADSPTTQDAGTAELSVGLIGPGPQAIPLAAVRFTPQAALTASDTNNAIISVYKRNAPDGGGGTTQTLLATASTFTPGLDGGTGSWSPFTPVSFTVVAGAYVSPADAITVAITKNGSTGVSVPQGELTLFTSIQ